MANENLKTMKSLIEAADALPQPSVPSSVLTAKDAALKEAASAASAAQTQATRAINSATAAYAARDNAIAKRNNAIAALEEKTYLEALEAKDVQIADLQTRLNTANVEAIVAEHNQLETYLAGDISKATIASVAEQTVTGSNITPKPTVTAKTGKVLTENTDFTYSYANNKTAGTATITVTGMGSCFFSKKTTFVIKAVSA